jgi:hypothetical protein
MALAIQMGTISCWDEVILGTALNSDIHREMDNKGSDNRDPLYYTKLV